ncbi:hypothetical protein GCM10025734_73730 [Kitasatospora paranensis]|uniref:N-acetylglucosamine kinase n=1 Tax=Kitasatospora paranensis TaxID=258053 RepID=UPI0031EBBB04
MTDLVLGVDAGGTGTRCVLATADGRIVGRGSAGGANFRSSGGREAARGQLAAALRAALGDTDRGLVRAGVLGLAGAGAAGHRTAGELAADAWSDAGLPGLPTVVPDLTVAFAAATDEPSGTLLLAGTGAIAARFEQRELVRRSDGHGWLLGDEGSGVWLGLNALRAVLAALDGRTGPTALTVPVAADLLGGPGAADLLCAPGDADRPGEPGGAARPGGTAEAEPAGLCQRLVAVAYPPQPARLAALAPLVEAAARAGTPPPRPWSTRPPGCSCAACRPSNPTGRPDRWPWRAPCC